MSEHNAFASLSPSLLARKGSAKPAMRRQDTSRFTIGGGAMPADDLGWNDWGHANDREQAQEQKRAKEQDCGKASLPAAPEAERPVPEVLRQIEQVTWRMNRPVPAARVAKREGRRAAFTLRLDAERHFRLKMAGVVLDRSAQVLVTEALDKYLSEIPEVAQLESSVRKRR